MSLFNENSTELNVSLEYLFDCGVGSHDGVEASYRYQHALEVE